MDMENFVGFLVATLPFWIPVLIGLSLVVRDSTDGLARMAGLLTLKPILTTPIWYVIWASLDSFFSQIPALASTPLGAGLTLLTALVLRRLIPALASILPGASLTLLTAQVFRSRLSGPRARDARLLLVLDCVRWLNSFLLVLTVSSDSELASCICSYAALIGLGLPTVYAVVAYLVVMSDVRHRQPLRHPVPEASEQQQVSPPPAEVETERLLATRLRAHVGWALWLRWVLASSVGWALGRVLGGAAGGALGRIFGSVVGGVLSGAVGGTLVGVMQWFVLRRQIYWAGWWVWASAVGSAMGVAMDSVVRSMGVKFGGVSWMVPGGVSLAATGALVGTMQWFVLRRQVYRAGWWVVTSTVGWAVGGVVRLAILGAAMTGLEGVPVPGVLWIMADAAVSVVVGIVGGVITGGPLVWLLRHPVPKGSDQEASTHPALPSEP